MEVVICAIAKSEDLYIKDGVNYHLNLGFDKIYIFDNSENESLSMSKYVNDERVIFIPLYNDHRERLQFIAYNDFYQNYKFDWCAFIDLDEYMVLDKPNIKEFIKTFPADCQVMKLNWHIFGDDELIKRDTSIPMNQFFKKRRVGHKYEGNGKQIIKGGIKGLRIDSSHWSHIGDNLPVQYQADYKKTDCKLFGFRNCDNAYINHYITKTLDEFLTQKLNRTDVVFQSKPLNMDYYWAVNKQTPEKLEYIKKWKNKGIS